MIVTEDSLALIRAQVDLHDKFIMDLHRLRDYSFVKMFNPRTGTLNAPPDLLRRGNDILAAAYVSALAIDQQSGDDCIDVNGQSLELKLAIVSSDMLEFSSKGNLVRSGYGNGLAHTLQAKFRVYDGTKLDHHNKDTAFVLLSYEHNCFISAFMMKGDDVQNLLMDGNQSGVQRKISLNQFIHHGYEINSAIPNIGWERYYSCLKNYVAGAEGHLPPDEAMQALEDWTQLADLNKLRKL